MKPKESEAESLVASKHQEYIRSAKYFRALYYSVRIGAGLSAGLLPFVVHTQPGVATGLSVAIVVLTIVDIVLSPKDGWKVFSRAADLLTVARLKAAGNYEAYKEQMEILLATENARLERLLSQDDLLNKVRGEKGA